VVWMYAGVAFGCGGTVCDGGTTTGGTAGGTTSTGGSIVQSGERIVFLQEDDEWTALVQIQTQGDPDSFGWVIPVPNPVDPEEVSIAPEGMMDELEQATAPSFQTDGGVTSGADTDDPSSSSSSSCSGCVDVPSLGELAEIGAGQLFGSAVVGPYEISSVGPEDMDMLAVWFTEGGYNLPPATWPIIEDYVGGGYSFVIVRMLPAQGEGQGTAETLRIPCGQAEPAIPLTLTSIAAVSDMVITTYVVSNRRYAPSGDWPEVDFDPQSVDPADPASDYVSQLQGALDSGGGRGFRTEFAGRVDSLDLSQETLRALGDGPYITRLQTWTSPEDMVSDPVFVPSDVLDDVSNVIDLRSSGRSGAGLLAPLLFGAAVLVRRRQRRALA
jgi:hypothetical protein